MPHKHFRFIRRRSPSLLKPAAIKLERSAQPEVRNRKPVLQECIVGIRRTALLATLLGGICSAAVAQTRDQPPAHIPPRRASQLEQAPAGVNTSLPRMPYLPWTETWWTRMYDAGIKYVRIGQYEDTSDQTGWDWIEQKKGVLRVAPQVDEYVDSLLANGATIELQLLYGNPIYTSPAGELPTAIAPTAGTVHNPDFNLYSIFWPPTKADQIAAFLRYARFMVDHFRGRVQYYSLWNEEDGSYWNPRPDAQQFGRLLAGFTRTVSEIDPNARIVFGGQASFSQDFARGALEACDCAGKLDVFDYHTYPGGFVTPAPPESVAAPATALREAVSSYPKIRPSIQFWEDEYNSVPSRGPEMNDAIQAKYVTRMIASNWAAGVPTFLWELVNDTSTSEGDDFGIIHGMMHKTTDFEPRPVYYAIQRINALLGDTQSDPAIRIERLSTVSPDPADPAKLSSYGFRSRSGKSLVLYWLPVESRPEKPLPPISIDVSVAGFAMEHPVLIDLESDRISALQWTGSGSGRSLRVPVKDSVMAIADADYFDWPVLPAAPSGLRSVTTGNSTVLTWNAPGEYATGVVVEKRPGQSGKWTEIAHLSADVRRLEEPSIAGDAFYRVYALGASGKSGYSNVAGPDLH